MLLENCGILYETGNSIFWKLFLEVFSKAELLDVFVIQIRKIVQKLR